MYSDGVHFRWYLHDLGHPWSDWDETLGVYRVDRGIMQRHIFDFRFRPRTGSRAVFQKPEVEISEPEVKNYSIGKLVGFCNETPIFVFQYLNHGSY